MNQRRRVIQGFWGALLVGNKAQAQLRIEVSGVGATQLPIVIAPFLGEEKLAEKVSAIISADLVRSGIFKTIEGASGYSEKDKPDIPRIRSLGGETFLSGSLNSLADGRFEIRCRMWDAVKNVDLGGQMLLISSSELRFAAHRLSDWIYEKLVGEKGVATTRISYVTKTVINGVPRFNLWVADADGENTNVALTSREPIISPAWSPNGQQLAYVSFESRKPVVYIHELVTGKRRAIANFKGSNSAPAWSPDGQSLVVTLSRDTGSQIYLLAANGAGDPRRVLPSSSIDTEAIFSPDGRGLYFVSDRGGSPQIYRMNMDGANVQRVSYSGNYNISPAISPDGQRLAYIARSGGAFKLMLQDFSTGALVALTDTTADERPSFSANGKQIIYATQLKMNGKLQEALMVSTLDGRVKSKLSAASGDIREPDWGPFLGYSLK